MNGYPPVGFYFSVTVGSENSDSENGFQEVSGVSVQIPIEEIQEGGLNQYKHKLPGAPIYTNLILKRGYIVENSPLALWLHTILSSANAFPITTQTINLFLLNEEGKPLKNWTFHNVWPVKWSVSDFNAQENTIVIESLEMAYSHFDM